MFAKPSSNQIIRVCNGNTYAIFHRNLFRLSNATPTHMSYQWTKVASKRRQRRTNAEETIDHSRQDPIRPTDPMSITNAARRTDPPLRSRSKRGSDNVDIELTPCDDDVKQRTLLLAHAIAHASRKKYQREDQITATPACASQRTDGQWRLFSEKNHRKFVRHVGDVAQVIVVGCTPSDYRAEKNNRARLRRADEALAQGIGGMF